MAGGPAGGAVDRFRFRRLEKPEEFRQAEELQRTALGAEASGVVPAPLQRAIQDQGGLILGAFADIYLAGCAISTIGWDGALLYHYSHVTAVRPEYRNHHLGFRLKTFQRDEVLRLGLTEIRWVFDPLVSRNAWLYVHRLGSTPERYLPHYFGQLPESGEAGTETDRLRTRWELAQPRVEQRLAGAPADRTEDRSRWEAAAPIVETEAGESGLRLPNAVGEPDGPTAHLEIPFDLALIHQHEPAAVRRWRHAVRDAFRVALDMRYRVDDFVVLPIAHERRSFYLLTRGARDEPGPSSAA
jgi:predicted GNAT superfamily acetyltransferase